MRSVLVLGFGNPGRLDDGLGLAVVEEIAGHPGVVAEHDYQLNIEHGALVAGFDTVVFVDAVVSGDEPCFFRRLMPRKAESFSSHVMRPESVLAFAGDGFGWDGAAYLLGVRGYEFNEYGERLSEPALENLGAAVALLRRVLDGDDMEAMTTAGPLDDSAAACNGGETCETANT
ncbi:MAG: hydrogenase maturation protease [Phycisphaerales bacterium]|nr:hydrogenase maturation protease [Phycisphaerales bacterium]